MDDPTPPKKPDHDLRQTLPTMADSGNDPSNDVTIPDYVEMEHEVPTLPAGTQVGKYTIDKVLGVGGMGAVYRATQSKPHRQVALKLIRPGVLSSKSIRRFDLEAEILGRLHHPNIAQIHEAGIDAQSGSPYFAMEYVDGQELGDYVNDKNLSTRQRLELFIKLCDAIEHAHAKGVIHRDLKPANVLVGADGEPKVLDFGVARATDSTATGATLQTNVGQLIGTLYYMSPEQAVGDTLNLDTRSDVYALGVVLYEILCGEIPYNLKDKAIHEAVRVIQDTNPTKLSRHDPTLRGDIEIIVGKALDKDKDRRYQSVASLSADIRRSLDNQPISARPPSTIYKTTKFVRRNTGLTISAAIVLIIFSIGTGFVVTQWIERNEARQLALDNMLTTLNEMDVQKGTGPALAMRLLNLYSDHGETIFTGDKESLAVFYTNIGEAYLGYGDYERALSSFVKSYGLNAKLYSPPHPLLATGLHNIARAQFFLKDLEQSKGYYERALSMRESLFSLDDPEAFDISTTLHHLGSVFLRLKDYDSAIDYYSRSKSIRMSLFGKDSLEVAEVNNSIASFYKFTGQHELAEPIFRDLLPVLRSLPEDNPKPLWEARTLDNLGDTLLKLERYEDAAESYSDALQLKQILLEKNSSSEAQTRLSLAGVYYRMQQYELAIEQAEEALRIQQFIGNERAINATRHDLEVIRAGANPPPPEPGDEQP